MTSSKPQTCHTKTRDVKEILKWQLIFFLSEKSVPLKSTSVILIQLRTILSLTVQISREDFFSLLRKQPKLNSQMVVSCQEGANFIKELLIANMKLIQTKGIKLCFKWIRFQVLRQRRFQTSLENPSPIKCEKDSSFFAFKEVD